MNLKIPSSLPLLLGLLSFASVCAFYMTVTIMEMMIGRPSSTAVLGFIFAPILAVIAGGVGAVVGLVLWPILRALGVNYSLSRTASRYVLVGATVALAAVAVAGGMVSVRSEREDRPRVIQDSDRIHGLATLPTISGNGVEAPLTFESLRDETDDVTVDWNGGKVRVVGEGDNEVTIRDNGGQLIASTDLSAFDYTTQIHSATFCEDAQGSRMLAVLVTLRATSGRSMLLIYDSQGRLTYQELLERRGYPETMRVTSTEEGKEILLVDQREVKAWLCQR